MCVPSPDTTCEPNAAGTTNGLVHVGDDLDETSYTPRLSLALRVAVPLFKHVWLDGLASITFAPFGHRDAYGESSSTMAPGAFPIPGEPGRSVQLGIGLRVGAP